MLEHDKCTLSNAIRFDLQCGESSLVSFIYNFFLGLKSIVCLAKL